MGLDMYLRAVVPSEIGYWRKANAIHGWFCDRINEGDEINCAPKRVDRQLLGELKAICEEVLENPEKASELLPTKRGFFFGTTDYDEYYFDKIKETIEIINRALELDCTQYEYDAWW